LTGATIAAAWATIVGEPKNQSPFTRPTHSSDLLTRFLNNNSQPPTTSALGERKNQPPFSRQSR
jgi:hypothetical protein